jgi:hypothetical protein
VIRRNVSPQSSTLKMDAIRFAETLVATCKTTRRSNSDDHDWQKAKFC